MDTRPVLRRERHHEPRYDIAIVGAGIIGCAIARQLARYDKTICLIEATDDIALGASKANGGLIHAGYDPAPGTMKAKMNARGCERMDVVRGTRSFHRTAPRSRLLPTRTRYPRAPARQRPGNGVPHLEIVGPDRIAELEPRANPDATCALYGAPPPAMSTRSRLPSPQPRTRSQRSRLLAAPQ
ncbi:MAG: NAD(P)/FAD-dependent oxidoreductase [Collinsella intestinalis]